MENPYEDPKEPGLPASDMKLHLSKTALVVTDPQVDFLQEGGVAWDLVKKTAEELNTVQNIERLFKAAKEADIVVAVSPHYYYQFDHEWKFAGAMEKWMHTNKMYDRETPYAELKEGSGADFMPQYKKYILDGKTIVPSPHKVYGPQQNDLVLQLQKRDVSQIILAGMSANLCVESHLRELLERGFEVAVVRDATAAAIIPEGDGYLAALVNFRFLTSALAPKTSTQQNGSKFQFS